MEALGRGSGGTVASRGFREQPLASPKEIKVSLYILVGLLSLYPTTTYILWAIPLSKNKLPEISENLVKRFKFIITTELIGFATIPLFATLMARGVGLG